MEIHAQSKHQVAAAPLKDYRSSGFHRLRAALSLTNVSTYIHAQPKTHHPAAAFANGSLPVLQLPMISRPRNQIKASGRRSLQMCRKSGATTTTTALPSDLYFANPQSKHTHIELITDPHSVMLDCSGRSVWSSSCCRVGAVRSADLVHYSGVGVEPVLDMCRPCAISHNGGYKIYRT